MQFWERDLQGSEASNAAHVMHDAAPLGKKRRNGMPCRQQEPERAVHILWGPERLGLSSRAPHPHTHTTTHMPPPYILQKKGSSCDVQLTVYNRCSRR